jgi:hypothetical protein
MRVILSCRGRLARGKVADVTRSLGFPSVLISQCDSSSPKSKPDSAGGYLELCSHDHEGVPSFVELCGHNRLLGAQPPVAPGYSGSFQDSQDRSAVNLVGPCHLQDGRSPLILRHEGVDLVRVEPPVSLDSPSR